MCRFLQHYTPQIAHIAPKMNNSEMVNFFNTFIFCTRATRCAMHAAARVCVTPSNPVIFSMLLGNAPRSTSPTPEFCVTKKSCKKKTNSFCVILVAVFATWGQKVAIFATIMINKKMVIFFANLPS